jgi:hypothetical protein
MPILTLSQAAKECGRSKSVLLQAIKTGRLSANRNELNQWQIDPAELFRVYPLERPENGQKEQYRTHFEREENALLQAQICHLEKQLATVEAVVDDLKTDRDHWRQQATALLTHKPEPAREEAPPEVGKLAVTLPAVLPRPQEAPRKPAAPPPAVPGPDVGERVALWFVAAFLLLVAGLAVGHWLGWV